MPYMDDEESQHESLQLDIRKTSLRVEAGARAGKSV